MDQKKLHRTVVICLLLGLGAIALYAPAFNFGFVNYDDPLYVVQNPHVNRGLTPGGLAWAFQAGYAANWHPLTWISHMMDVTIYGLHPGGHHATNIILHAINSVLVFLVLVQFSGAFWRCAVVAALFACHPLHVESVAWIAERKDVLSTFWWLLAMGAWHGYIRNARARSGPAITWYVAALVFFACGLMSKPMVMTLPCILLLMDWWPLGRLKTDPAPDMRQAISLVAEKIPFFLLSIGSGIISIIAEHREGSVSVVEQLPFKFRLATAAFGCFRYLAKTFWPWDLGPMYPFVTNASRPQLLGVGLTLVIVTVVALRTWKTRPYWLFGWAWFLVTLFPTMNLVTGGGQPMADRYMYIPSIGLFVLVCWEVFDFGASLQHPRAVTAGFWGAAIAGCCVVTSIQLQYWKSDDRLLAHIAMPNLNFVGHANYAAYLMQKNRLPEAEDEAQKAVRISPRYGALEALLGNIYLREGKPDQSIEALNRALALDPRLVDARLPLGRAYAAKKMLADAGKQFQTVAAIEPDNVEAHTALAATLMIMHKDADSIAEYKRALSLDLNQPATLNDLAWILATDSHAELRNGTEAVAMATRACQLTRNTEPLLIGTLAAAYAEAGGWDDAMATAQKAHNLALAKGLKELAETNLKLEHLYRSHQPYHQK